MTKQELSKLKRRVKALQKQIGEVGPVMRGSVVVIGTRNKQPYFSRNRKGKTEIIYLGEKRKAQAEEYVTNFKTLMALVDEMTALNMKILKETREH